MATYEEMREKGFTDVWGYGGEYSELKRLCIGERFILLGVYQSIEDILTANDKTPILIKGKIGQGYENEFLLYEIGKKREIILVDGEINPLTEYFIKRSKEYMSEKSRLYRKKAAEKGEFAGGYAPYGYYIEKKELYVDDYESFVVKFIFYRRSQGCGYSGIAKELNLRGFRNRNGKEFTQGSIRNIEDKKRLYQGYIEYNGKETRGKYAAILGSDELLSEEWKKRVFDASTEARIEEHRKRYHSENSVPREIKPYIVIGTEPKKKTRRRR